MERQHIEKFLTFFKPLLEKPGIFGVNKVDDINFIILGYRCATDTDEGTLISSFFSEFSDWLSHNWEISHDFDWVKMINLYAGGSYQHSIQLFREKLIQFVENELGWEW